MRILIVSSTYPTPERPRQGMFNFHLVNALRERHEVRVVAPVPWPQRIHGRAEQCSGTEGFDSYPTFFYPPKILRRFFHHFYWWSINSSLRQVERDFLPELVMGYWLHPDTRAAQWAAERFQVPCLAVSGGTDLRVLPKQPGRRRAVQRVLRHVDRLVVVSEELKTHAIELGMPEDRINVVYRGIDSKRFFRADPSEARIACGLNTEDVVLVWVGRLEPIKNPSLLIDAAVQWHRRWGARLKILIVGNGSLRARLASQISERGLEGCVQLEGELSQYELALRYNAANLTVLTSLSEGIPNVLLESLACHTTFVATRVGGVAEIASPGLDGLVDSGDVQALVKKVIEKVEIPPKQIRRFVPDGLVEMADRYDAVFAKVMQ